MDAWSQEQKLALVGGIAVLVIAAILAFAPITVRQYECGSVVAPKTIPDRPGQLFDLTTISARGGL